MVRAGVRVGAWVDDVLALALAATPPLAVALALARGHRMPFGSVVLLLLGQSDGL